MVHLCKLNIFLFMKKVISIYMFLSFQSYLHAIIFIICKIYFFKFVYQYLSRSLSRSKECHSKECHSKECHSKECHSKEWHLKECHSKECNSKECHSKECHSKECHSKECYSKECHSKECHSKECHSKECHSKEYHLKDVLKRSIQDAQHCSPCLCCWLSAGTGRNSPSTLRLCKWCST